MGTLRFANDQKQQWSSLLSFSSLSWLRNHGNAWRLRSMKRRDSKERLFPQDECQRVTAGLQSGLRTHGCAWGILKPTSLSKWSARIIVVWYNARRASRRCAGSRKDTWIVAPDERASNPFTALVPVLGRQPPAWAPRPIPAASSCGDWPKSKKNHKIGYSIEDFNQIFFFFFFLFLLIDSFRFWYRMGSSIFVDKKKNYCKGDDIVTHSKGFFCKMYFLEIPYWPYCPSKHTDPFFIKVMLRWLLNCREL